MGGRVCGQAIALAAIHLRSEPDARMSARPGPSGGYPVRGIPTGSDSYTARVRDDDDTRTATRAHTAVDSLFVQWGCSDTGTFSIGYALGWKTWGKGTTRVLRKRGWWAHLCRPVRRR